MPGPGLPLTWSRTYNSQATAFSDAQASDLGVGWQHAFATHLIPTDVFTQTRSDGTKVTTTVLTVTVIVSPQGNRLRFNQANGLVALPGVRSTLAKVGATYVQTLPDQTRYTFNLTGTLIAIEDAQGWRLELHRRDNVLTIADPTNLHHRLEVVYTGMHITQVRDAAGRTVTYTYTGNQRTQVDETLGSATRSITYTYDGLQRLTQEQVGGGNTTTYAYDGVGNRTGVWVNGTQTVSHTFNAANQVVGWQYDAAGNLRSDGVNQYTYDALNRLTSANGTAYAYNGDGVLVQAGATRYTQDLAAPRSQILRDGTATYLYGVERLATITGGMRTWELHDALGSVRATLDDAGSLQTTARYDAWGTPLAGTTPDPFGFTGELHDPTSGLVYLRARWYDPSSGTFTSRDPFAGYPQQPYSQHPYQYGYSDPVRWTDPSGACTSWVIDAVAHAMGGELRLRCVYRGWGNLNWGDGGAYLRGMAGAAADMAAAIPAMPGTPQFTQQVMQGAWMGYTLATNADAQDSAWQTVQQVANPLHWPGMAWQSLTQPFGAFAQAFLCDDSEALGRAAVDAGVTVVGVAESAVAARALVQAIPVRFTALRQAGTSRVAAALQATAESMQAVGGLCSFSGDTAVATNDGEVPISALAVGDQVLAYNESTGETGVYAITATWAHTDPVVTTVTVNSEEIETTPEHPFYAMLRGWVSAGKLRAGDSIRRADGSYGVVEDVAQATHSQVMYNLTVDTAHTFFVGEGPWLVHNDCLHFSPDDLVYGPSAGGRLRQLADTAGGRLLTDLTKPTSLKWEAFSIQTLDAAATSGIKVHFELTYMDDIAGVLAGTGPYAHTTTAVELRYIRHNWDKFQGIVHFYAGKQEVHPPWIR